ncbi:MAG: ABC transporter ATP-binding protein [Clostridiales Family XIII bacterium]|jgi:simple sugar transport system ATP-binding protein|nr:ABC transporter ATP-binding protein [Clostridiales Family XIII bacterium]
MDDSLSGTVAASESPPAVDMLNITMMFGAFKANDNVCLTVPRRSIHAILGENGAGKSTLMNVLYGLLQPTSGEIRIKGERVSIDSPSRAIELGVGMVHQHFMLVPPFTVVENIILGREPMRGAGVMDMGKARADVKELSDRYGLNVDPDAKVEDISVGMQQRAEILKVLYRGADILILDEPTSSLTPQEIKDLERIMKNLVAEGKTVIIITHKLAEIKAIADLCTIIRAGKTIDTVRVSDVSEQELASMMVGRTVEFSIDKKPATPGEVVLNVENLVVRDYWDHEAVNGLNLTVRAGEIVGMAGVDGNGQSEFVAALTGLRKAESGVITISGVDMFNKSPRTLFEHGVSSIPEDRQKHGLVLDFSVAENLVLQNVGEPEFSRHGFLRKDNIMNHARELTETYDVRPAGCAAAKAGSLSGGNQQKVIIAREVTNDKELLICVNPTRGLDVGAIEYVHRHIVSQRDAGKAVLLISFELDEIMKLSDRIDVVFRGKVAGSVEGGKADQAMLGLMMAGGEAHAANR